MQQQLTIGTLLRGGTYRIEKVLGQGSFGITYLAVHVNLGKKVAIKEFFMRELNSRGDDGSITGMTDGSLSHNYYVKFQKEAINLSQLDHSNIVRVTDSFSENGTFYYVMDFIEGQNLNDYVKSHHVDEAEAVSIIKSVADALIYMHEEKHMLHLDLKPGNVMRRESDGHIFLIDFGLSKHFDTNGQPETSTTIGLGTEGYAPIEQGNRAKNGEFRPTIDVYSLGATFYKLLTGETPPPAAVLVSDEDLLTERLHKRGVSDKLVNLIEEAMSPSVKKRIQTIADFKAKLSGINSFDKGSSNIENHANSDSGKIDEETKIINEPRQEAGHPDFDEASYVIDSIYADFPIITENKARNGDLDAVIAYGMMALRGIGAKQDLDIARGWFVIAKDKGDDRGAKLIGQWPYLMEKYGKNSAKQGQTKEKSIPPTPSSNMAWAVISMSLCLPLGILALVQSLKVDNLYSAGNYEAALEASNKSKEYCTWSILCLFAVVGICLIIGLTN